MSLFCSSTDGEAQGPPIRVATLYVPPTRQTSGSLHSSVVSWPADLARQASAPPLEWHDANAERHVVDAVQGGESDTAASRDEESSALSDSDPSGLQHIQESRASITLQGMLVLSRHVVVEPSAPPMEHALERNMPGQTRAA